MGTFGHVPYKCPIIFIKCPNTTIRNTDFASTSTYLSINLLSIVPSIKLFVASSCYCDLFLSTYNMYYVTFHCIPLSLCPPVLMNGSRCKMLHFFTCNVYIDLPVGCRCNKTCDGIRFASTLLFSFFPLIRSPSPSAHSTFRINVLIRILLLAKQKPTRKFSICPIYSLPSYTRNRVEYAWKAKAHTI